MIIKIHGTSGSGKTTIIRDLMAMSDPPPATGMNTETFRIDAHLMHLPGVMKPVIVLGPYGKAHCGGLDAVPGTVNHARMLHQYASVGHVLYEGLLGSECYGAMGKASEQYGDEHIFAFLDTPIETCIARVKMRRLEAGNNKPLNEINTRERVPKIERLKTRLHYHMHRVVITLDHTKATQQVLELLKSAP
jgi:ABC-type dipeptide/oligopeptide/nickel transport system ATPase component